MLSGHQGSWLVASLIPHSLLESALKGLKPSLHAQPHT